MVNDFSDLSKIISDNLYDLKYIAKNFEKKIEMSKDRGDQNEKSTGMSLTVASIFVTRVIRT